MAAQPSATARSSFFCTLKGQRERCKFAQQLEQSSKYQILKQMNRRGP